MYAYGRALTGAGIPVGTMLPVAAATVPADIRRAAGEWVQHNTHGQWAEVACPLSSQGGCDYGCKVYARRWGKGLRYAVLHSRTYGHPGDFTSRSRAAWWYEEDTYSGPTFRECH